MAFPAPGSSDTPPTTSGSALSDLSIVVEALGWDWEPAARHEAERGLEIIGSRALPALIAGSAGSSTSRREAIARLLGNLGHPAGRSAVISFLGDSEATVCTAAAAALGEIGDKRDVGRLRRMVHDPSPAISAAAISALSSLLATVPVSETVRTQIANAWRERVLNPETDDTPRIAAIQALGALGDYRAVPEFHASIRRGGIPVRVAAIDALGTLREASAATLLLRLAEDNQEPAAVRVAAAVSLDTLQGEGSQHELTRLVQSNHPDPRGGAAARLARVGTDLKEIISLATSNEIARRFRLSIVTGLGRNPHPAAAAGLIAILDAERFRVRVRDGSAPMQPPLADDLARVRAAAATQLGRKTHDDRDRNLAIALLDRDPGVRLAASAALVTPDDPVSDQVATVLIDTLQDLNQPVGARTAAIEALGKRAAIADIADLPTMLHWIVSLASTYPDLADGDQWDASETPSPSAVALAAARHLAPLGDKTARILLHQATTSADARIRVEAGWSAFLVDDA